MDKPILEVTVRFSVDDLSDNGRFSSEDVTAAIAHFNELGAGCMELGELGELRGTLSPSANIANLVQDIFVAYLETNYAPVA